MQTGDAPALALARLTYYLIAKSIVEALLVGALAASFYFTAFHPSFRGLVEEASAQHVTGWALDEAEPYRRVEVQLYIDGLFAGSRVADISRPDVKAAGHAVDEWHGFRFDVPLLKQGEHEARVYAVHGSGGGMRRTLHLIGSPVRFSVDASPAAILNR